MCGIIGSWHKQCPENYQNELNKSLELLFHRGPDDKDLFIEKVEVPPVEFQSVLRLPSGDFQKLCRDMNQLADDIEIKSSGSELMFSINNDWVNQQTIIRESSGGSGMSYIQNLTPDEVIQGVFSLRYLVLFSKCTNLCQNIEIYIKNDYPIIIRYSVANLGEVKFCLAPKNNDD
mgnify:CR=1 FL=1